MSLIFSILIPGCWCCGLPSVPYFQFVWQLVGEPEPLATFKQHTDYVNCLAGGRSRAKVASAGLRAEVFLWDIQKGIRIHEQVQQTGIIKLRPPRPVHQHPQMPCLSPCTHYPLQLSPLLLQGHAWSCCTALVPGITRTLLVLQAQLYSYSCRLYFCKAMLGPAAVPLFQELHVLYLSCKQQLCPS